MNKITKRINECIKTKSEYLDLSHLNLSSFPEELPNFLQNINCSNNQITKLPEKLPYSLQEISCDNNQITKLPEKLPDSLQIIYCYNNQITKLPEKLPDSLQEIYCYNNKITKLPEKLPNSLQRIDCENNQITKLRFFNKNFKNLREFECNNNKLEDVSLVLLNEKYFNCGNKDELKTKSLYKIMERMIKITKTKRLIKRCGICRILLNMNYNDCSYIISQYV